MSEGLVGERPRGLVLRPERTGAGTIRNREGPRRESGGQKKARQTPGQTKKGLQWRSLGGLLQAVEPLLAEAKGLGNGCTVALASVLAKGNPFLDDVLRFAG